MTSPHLKKRTRYDDIQLPDKATRERQLQDSRNCAHWTVNLDGWKICPEYYTDLYSEDRRVLKDTKEFRFPDSSGSGTYFVRSCYDGLYEEFWQRAMTRKRAVLITGQPRTGSSQPQLVLESADKLFIQASSLNPENFRWAKYTPPLQIALPAWTLEELHDGFWHHWRAPEFFCALEATIHGSDPELSDESVELAIDVLQKAVDEAKTQEAHSLRVDAELRAELAGISDLVLMKRATIVDILILDALERCGPCPTEIYNSITYGRAQASIPPDIFERICGGVSSLYSRPSLLPDADLDHFVLILPRPCEGKFESEVVCSPVWQLHFKSHMIRRMAVEYFDSLGNEEQVRLCRVFKDSKSWTAPIAEVLQERMSSNLSSRGIVSRNLPRY
ncbi:hypothetical protein V5O48_003419 [Marasmius crinis-equi]|uniref:Uncharacterized protein n=1 Tax=Marasmius crinis-equi TaxID=585013 RepID=A0ABR3FTB1_9AGAR